MVSFVQPRRFSECWQMSADFPGTIAQQMAVRDTFALVHDTDKWKLFKKLDHSINHNWLRSFLIFGFPPDDMFPQDKLAVAGITGINLRASFALSAIPNQALHELGHVHDKHFLTAADRLWFMAAAGIDPNLNTWNANVQETWADAYRDCLKGTSWQTMWPLLLAA